MRFEYDAGGQLIALYNQKNEAYRFSRDSLSRLEESCDLTGCREVYRYDSRSNICEITRYPAPVASGQEALLPQVTRLAYDAAGRVQYRENGDGAVCYRYGKNTLTLQRFAPDDWQRKQRGDENVVAQDSLHLVTDEYGSLLEEHNQAGVFTHRYDELGNRTETQMPDGRRLKRLYYGSGHLQQLNLEDNNGQQTVLAEFERNSLHQEISRTQGSLTLRTEYDAAGRAGNGPSGAAATWNTVAGAALYLGSAWLPDEPLPPDTGCAGAAFPGGTQRQHLVPVRLRRADPERTAALHGAAVLRSGRKPDGGTRSGDQE